MTTKLKLLGKIAKYDEFIGLLQNHEEWQNGEKDECLDSVKSIQELP